MHGTGTSVSSRTEPLCNTRWARTRAAAALPRRVVVQQVSPQGGLKPTDSRACGSRKAAHQGARPARALTDIPRPRCATHSCRRRTMPATPVQRIHSTRIPSFSHLGEAQDSHPHRTRVAWLVAPLLPTRDLERPCLLRMASQVRATRGASCSSKAHRSRLGGGAHRSKLPGGFGLITAEGTNTESAKRARL